MNWNKIPEDRKCLMCMSKHTKINPKTGYAIWYCLNGGFICSTCKQRLYMQEQRKIRNQSTMEMSEILPVSSNKLLGELWP